MGNINFIPERKLNAGELRQANKLMVDSLGETYRGWPNSRAGLGQGTSHRDWQGTFTGTRMVSFPVEVPGYIYQYLRRATDLLVEEAAHENDADTVARVNLTFAASLQKYGVEDPKLFSEETVLAVKEKSFQEGLAPVVDFVSVPIEVRNGLPVAVGIDDRDNHWEEVHRRVEKKELQFMFMGMEGQGSFKGYYGFTRNFLINGAFGGQVDLGRFDWEVRSRIFAGWSDFSVVDYKVHERPGEIHHALPDKVTTNQVWGRSDRHPIDIRDLVGRLRTDSTEGQSFLNNTTPREIGYVMSSMDEEERAMFKRILNSPDMWTEHPVAMAMLTKGTFAPVYEKYGPVSMLIPSFCTPGEVDLEGKDAMMFIDKPVSGDSGYGIEFGRLDELKARNNRLIQPVVDILRIVPNGMTEGPLAPGGILELRTTALDGFGFTRVGAHKPYTPENGMTMSHQEYIIDQIKEMAKEIESTDSCTQAEAWFKTLVMANAGFGAFIVT